MYRYGCQTPCCFVSAAIYLEKLRIFSPGFQLTQNNCQRVLLIGVMTASKFYDDIFYR
jgi:hypothetical protein